MSNPTLDKTVKEIVEGICYEGAKIGCPIPLEINLALTQTLQAERQKRDEMVEYEKLLTLKGVQHKWFSDGELKTLEDIEIQIKALTQPNNPK